MKKASLSKAKTFKYKLTGIFTGIGAVIGAVFGLGVGAGVGAAGGALVGNRIGAKLESLKKKKYANIQFEDSVPREDQ